MYRLRIGDAAVSRCITSTRGQFLTCNALLSGWSTIARQVALMYTATIIVALAAQQAGRPDLIRSPRLVLGHVWEGIKR